MRFVRVLITILLLILFCWLNWWVMPDLAIIRLKEKGALMPEACYLLMGQEDYRFTGHRVLKELKFDWSGVPAAWPYVVVGVILGLGLGYVIGELARRKFAVDVASKEAIKSACRIKTEAIIVEGRAEGKLLQAESREKDTSYIQNTLRKEIDECRAARTTADEQIRICEEKLRKGENTERELDKAKRAIEKLQRQIRRLKNENEEGK